MIIKPKKWYTYKTAVDFWNSPERKLDDETLLKVYGTTLENIGIGNIGDLDFERLYEYLTGKQVDKSDTELIEKYYEKLPNMYSVIYDMGDDVIFVYHLDEDASGIFGGAEVHNQYTMVISPYNDLKDHLQGYEDYINDENGNRIYYPESIRTAYRTEDVNMSSKVMIEALIATIEKHQIKYIIQI